MLAVMRTVNPEQHARKRAKILQAAAEEFAVNGVDGTSTAGICRRAGIGSGTLFHYFPTKRDIVHALFRDDLARNAEVHPRVLRADAEQGFDLLVGHLLAELANPLTPGLAATAVLQANRDPEFAEILTTDTERTHEVLTGLLRRMADDGGYRLALPADRLARWIQKLVDAAYLMAGDPGFDAEVESAELRRVIARLVGGPSA
ncbi:TetR family transcriptional regulator [Saccharopolyspora erythraea NRRL 2338]|uniref:Transcriptional regulator, TetR family n=3 Tax=Saccharopolyspora erythraea TaxID=1836 RepID=A4FA23_SACEN|nr:TetR family transcriptional regulator [Saccharopolyspora erythraea D]PFG94683.1 TetR family transcriptional regulator [Saccharopolyspora erythraea NRRL 2338]QRK93395.1 TetR/AcrR family transcriptional regulator [Saccharopolyspora erythraea]CAM00898.1 transcriptional regulator, TetR family [Saccharopolyspora erythraea NRRL 2338]